MNRFSCHLGFLALGISGLIAVAILGFTVLFTAHRDWVQAMGAISVMVAWSAIVILLMQFAF